MKKIIPHLWYDKEAKEAATLYMSLFDKSKLLNETIISDTPSGDAEIVYFELAGQEFQAISAGPYFKFNPSISLMVACKSIQEVDAKWKVLSEGGSELMPLGEYPFSKYYGWTQDRYGLSWQLMLVESQQEVQKITPNFLFSSSVCGKAEEAIRYYVEVFENLPGVLENLPGVLENLPGVLENLPGVLESSKEVLESSEIVLISRYGEGEAEAVEAKVNYAAFKLCGSDFSAMDNGFDVDFNFNEAFSLIIRCKDQEEIDYFSEKLSAVPEAEQCGWVKDQFGVSWQIVPANMEEIFLNGTEAEIQRVTEAFLKMKKFDLKALENARLGH